MTIKFIAILLVSLVTVFSAKAQTADVDTDIFVHEKYELYSLTIPYLTATEPDILSGADVEATNDFCFYSNTYISPSNYPQFQIGAVSQNGTFSENPGQFLSKNAYFEIEYYVSYSINGGSFVPFTEGTPIPNITLDATPSTTCQNGLGNNMTLKISLLGSSLPTARAGVYSDTLYISVFPPA